MDGGVPSGGIRRVVVRERRRRLRTHFGGYRDRRGGGYAELREDQADDRTGERGLLQDRQADADLRIRVCGPRRHRPSGLHRGARRSGRGSFRADVGRPDAQGGVLLRRGGTRRLRPADYGSHVRTFHDRLRFVAGRSPLRDESRREPSPSRARSRRTLTRSPTATFSTATTTKPPRPSSGRCSKPAAAA